MSTLAVLAIALAQVPVPAPSLSPPAVVEALDEVAARELWPGFDPRRIPIAIFDGEATWLFRHPAPSDGFEPAAGHAPELAVHRFAGRHPAITANSSADIGGVSTATLLPSVLAPPVENVAALLAHECFHVFQRERHPGWVGNEAVLFTYPVEDRAALALRRLETLALRYALDAAGDADARAWAITALEQRQARFRLLPSDCVQYERATEWNEGLATWVEHTALRRAPHEGALRREYPAIAVRERCYGSGLALALLLDRIAPGWPARLEVDDDEPLDAMLHAALADGVADGEVTARDFDPDVVDGVELAAEREIAAMREHLAARRKAFLAADGWRLVVEARGGPLAVAGFDPLNVVRLDGGEVLHDRYLSLQRDGVELELLGRAALTEPAGGHPLFTGVRRVVVTGLEAEPTVETKDGAVVVELRGLRLRAARASTERSARGVTIRLDP